MCCIQCYLHLFPFFESIWIFSWFFSFVAVTCPMYSGASAFLFIDENPAINPIAFLKLNVKRSILLFGFPFWSLAIQNVGIHNAAVYRTPEVVLPCFNWEAANIIFHAHLIVMIYTIHVTVVQLKCFVADFLGSHYDPASCLCEQHFFGLNLYWQVLQFYCLAMQWTPSLSYHPGMICKQTWNILPGLLIPSGSYF